MNDTVSEFLNSLPVLQCASVQLDSQDSTESGINEV